MSTDDYRLTLALDALHAAVRTLREDDAEFVADLLVALPDETAEVETAILALGRAATHAKTMASACKQIAQDTASRAKRFADREERLRGMIYGAMQTLERMRIEAPDMTISLRPGLASVRVTDETVIPEEYWKTERTLVKSALAEDIKQGVVVPGAELSNGQPTLAIRRT